MSNSHYRRHGGGGGGRGDAEETSGWSWTAAGVASSVAAGISALLFSSASSSRAGADVVARLEVTPVRILLARATPGGDIGLAAVRATVEPADGQAVLQEAGAGAAVVIARAEYTSLSHVIVGGKLEEKRTYLDADVKSVPWHLRDAAGGIALLDASLGDPPLRRLPKSFTHVQDAGQLEVSVNRHSINVNDSRDRERSFGIERVASVLTAGTLLTVVGRATVDASGAVRISAGAGPFAVSTDTLAGVVDSFRSAGSWKAGFAWFFLAVSGGILVATAVSRARAAGGAGATEREDPTPPPLAPVVRGKQH